MRKIFILLAIVTVAIFLPKKSYSQTVILFEDNFDIFPFKMANTVVGAGAPPLFWQDVVVTKNLSPGSATDTVGNRSTSYLTAPKVSTKDQNGRFYDNIGISFDQICYIDFFDEAIVEYSFDGTNWARLPFQINNVGTLERVYTGGSLYQTPQLAFSKLSNPVVWPVNDSQFVYGRNTTAWITESFNITPVIDREERQTAIRPDSVQIRLGLFDNPSSPIGRTGTHQWWIDNFVVRGSNCELTPPIVRLDDPPVNYPSRYEDRVYWLGPYDFNAQITDQSQIDTAYIAYYITRPDPIPPLSHNVIGVDTAAMVPLGFSRFEGFIDSTFFNLVTLTNDVIQPGDSVYWKLVAIDKSPCSNSTQEPPAGFEAFQVRGNLPLACGTQPIFNFPHYQTFNGVDFIPGPSGVLAEDWINAEGDFHDFYVNQGPTSGFPETGPSQDHPGGGKYLYVEATGFRDSTAYLLSPCIDLFEEPNTLVRFYLNQNGVGGDTVHVDLFDPTPAGPLFPDGKFILDIIPPIGGNKNDVWLPFEFNTYRWRFKVVQMRLRATPSAISEKTDIGLDSFKIVPAPIHDLRMNAVVLAPFVPASISDSLIVNVQNVGALPSDFIDISYEVVNFDSTIRETVGPYRYNIPIVSGENVNIKLPPYTVPLRNFNVKAWFTYSRDQRLKNDTSEANSIGLFYKTLDCQKEYFDEDTLWVGLASDTTSNSNNWEVGTPTFNRTNSAYTAPNSWDILLDDPYTGNGGVEQLITQFYDLRGADSIIMAFMNNRGMRTSKDGVFVEFSVNRGLNWTYIDNVEDTLNRKHWYNSFLSAGGFGGQFCFSDTTRNIARNFNNWVESEIYLPDTVNGNAEVLFRFIFFAEDDPGTDAGMSIDNFLVYEPKPVDIETHHFLKPLDDCDLFVDQNFVTVFKNRGLDTVYSFTVNYQVKNLQDNSIQTGTEVVNRKVAPRDTIVVTSVPTFNMFQFGDYEIMAVTSLAGDACPFNDTLRKVIENIEGCEFIFEVRTSNYREGTIAVDSSFWRFDYTNGGRRYSITDDYLPWLPNDTIQHLICIKDSSELKFNLGDNARAVANYSFIAYNGENDTIIVNSENGGPNSPEKNFLWVCPPERSGTVIDIIINNNEAQLPVPGLYSFTVKILNNGLDSLDFVEVGLSIDDRIFIKDSVGKKAPDFFSAVGLQYNRRFNVDFPPAKDLAPGDHIIKAWTADPNGLPDLRPSDDTLSMVFSVLDTTAQNGGFDEDGNPIFISVDKYCTGFEDSDDTTQWVSLNPYTYNQRFKSFERGTPSTDSINGAYKGSKAWVTNLDGNYRNVDSAAVVSPLFYLEKDSCYKMSFYHKYRISDAFNDGGQVQMNQSITKPQDWQTIFYEDIDSVNTGNDTTPVAPITGLFQKNWHNARHIKAIPDNTNNSGWTGNSDGWIKSENIFGGVADINRYGDSFPTYGKSSNYFAVFRWRFESDFTKNDEGWAIDEFCLERINPQICWAVSLRENAPEKDATFLGQNIPNPATSSTSIPYYLPKSGKVEFTVVNVMGQPVYEMTQGYSKGTGYFDVDISNYSAGVYYYWMIFDGKKYSKKMIVTK